MERFEEATVSCATLISSGCSSCPNENYPDYYNCMHYSLRVMWATPCDGKIECYDGYDEENCASPIWLSPVIVIASGFLLFIAMIWYIFKYINEGIDEVLINGEASYGQLSNSRSKRAIFIAILTELGDYGSIKDVYDMEIVAHGSKGEAICCLKVQIRFSLFTT